MSDQLYFAALYNALKSYNKTEEASAIIYGLTCDFYIVSEHRTLLATLASATKIETGLSLLSARYKILTDEALQDALDYFDEHKISTTYTELNIEPFFEFFDITDSKERKIFRWVVAATQMPSLDMFKNSYVNFQVKEYFGIANAMINDLFYAQGSIFSKDLFDRKDNFMWVLKPEFAKILEIENFTIKDLSDYFYNSNLESNLRIEQFSHLNEDIPYVEKIINKSLEEKLKGTNILFWGLPGTGKTELAIILAKKYGWKLVSVSESNKDRGKEKSRAQRVQALVSAQKIFAGDDRTVLLFDEAEDLFKLDFNSSHSKLFINRITEGSEIPIIWTTNSLHSLGEPFLRRMSFNLEFEFPDSKTRTTIWEEYLDIKDDNIIKNLAREYKLTPASIKVVSDAVNITGVSEYKELRRIVNKTQKLLNYGEDVNVAKYVDYNNTYYDIAAANASLDLEDMKNQLANANPNFSLCLYGPSGTGKSEYVKYLASQLGYQVLYKRASELLGMYVGQTEKQIAALFKEATREGKFILIDEGDTFLRDRTGAQRSWEVSQVNEFLSHMEMLSTPLAITTNLFDSLDAAALRRFTFKIKFDFLTEDQRTGLFVKYFNMEPPDYIKKMEILTPGDFANVKRKIDILNITDEKVILKFLDEEIKQKPQFIAESKFGFTRS